MNFLAGVVADARGAVQPPVTAMPKSPGVASGTAFGDAGQSAGMPGTAAEPYSMSIADQAGPAATAMEDATGWIDAGHGDTAMPQVAAGLQRGFPSVRSTSASKPPLMASESFEVGTDVMAGWNGEMPERRGASPDSDGLRADSSGGMETTATVEPVTVNSRQPIPVETTTGVMDEQIDHAVRDDGNTSIVATVRTDPSDGRQDVEAMRSDTGADVDDAAGMPLAADMPVRQEEPAAVPQGLEQAYAEGRDDSASVYREAIGHGAAATSGKEQGRGDTDKGGLLNSPVAEYHPSAPIRPSPRSAGSSPRTGHQDIAIKNTSGRPEAIPTSAKPAAAPAKGGERESLPLVPVRFAKDPTKVRTPVADGKRPLPEAPREPQIEIGQIDVVIESPAQPVAKAPARAAAGGFASRLYLRRL